jgi:hypothetical protein
MMHHANYEGGEGMQRVGVCADSPGFANAAKTRHVPAYHGRGIPVCIRLSIFEGDPNP